MALPWPALVVGGWLLALVLWLTLGSTDGPTVLLHLSMVPMGMELLVVTDPAKAGWRVLGCLFFGVTFCLYTVVAALGTVYLWVCLGTAGGAVVACWWLPRRTNLVVSPWAPILGACFNVMTVPSDALEPAWRAAVLFVFVWWGQVIGDRTSNHPFLVFQWHNVFLGLYWAHWVALVWNGYDATQWAHRDSPLWLLLAFGLVAARTWLAECWPKSHDDKLEPATIGETLPLMLFTSQNVRGVVTTLGEMIGGEKRAVHTDEHDACAAIVASDA